MRTDYKDADDSEGSATFISLHGTLQSANKAAEQHVKKHIEHMGLKDPNTSISTYDHGLKGYIVIVDEEDYHSFEARVYTEELIDGSLVVPRGSAEAYAAEKVAEAQPQTSVRSSRSRNQTKQEKAESDVEESKDDVVAVQPPKGSPDCLSDHIFIVTGILEGVTRDETEKLIKSCGGKVAKSLNKSVNCVVVGDQPGPKKLDQVKEWGLKTVDQQGLYDMIEQNSSKGVKRHAPDAKAKGSSKRGKAS